MDMSECYSGGDMPDPKRYVNIGVDRSYFPELREAKLQYQVEIGETLSWSEFFRLLVSRLNPPQFAAMGQGASVAEMDGPTSRELTDEEVAELGYVRNDALTVEMSSLIPGSRVDLTDASCALIAEKLAERMKS